jgi:Ca-activated chloride channel family protein
MFWTLLILPLLVGAYFILLRRKRAEALRYPALGLLRAAAPGGRFKRHLPALLGLLGLSAMLFALTRPQAVVSVLAGRETVILAMDISGSMRARDIKPSRFEAAKAAADAFVRGQGSKVEIGVVAFAATATLVQPPTRSREDVLSALGRFRLQRGTAVGSGILASLQAIFENAKIDIGPIDPGQGQGQGQALPLDPSAPPPSEPPPPVEPGYFRSAIVILLTDGQTNTGPSPLDAAHRAADLGVRVFTVGLGTKGGEVLGFEGWSMRAQLDEEALKAIADLTRGRYYKADSDANLLDIYRDLGSELTMEKEKMEITALFTALAAALVLASAGLSLLWYRRIF